MKSLDLDILLLNPDNIFDMLNFIKTKWIAESIADFEFYNTVCVHSKLVMNVYFSITVDILIRLFYNFLC